MTVAINICTERIIFILYVKKFSICCLTATEHLST